MTASAWLASTSASEPGAKWTRPFEASCRRRDSSQTDVSFSSPPTSRLRGPNLRRDSALRALEQHCDATRMKHVERARLELRAEQSPDDTRGVVRLDDERSGRLRQRVELEACSRDEGESPLGAAHEAREVVAGDVLHDLPSGVRDRPVREDERRAEDEVARCAEAMAQRAGEVLREERPDRRVARGVEGECAARSLREPREARTAERPPRPCTSGRPDRARGSGSARAR